MQLSPAGHVVKAFLMLDLWAQSFAFCLPVMSFDACHLKCKEGGAFFLATALSPNRDVIVIAADIGTIEDGEHWAWFLRLIREKVDLSSKTETVLMSDREKALESVIHDVFPTIPHGICSVHVMKNVITNHPTDSKRRVHTLATCLTVSEINTVMQEVRTTIMIMLST